MRHVRQRRAGAGALEIVEEAVHLLRLAPLSVLGSHYVGSLPFVIGLLYFWAEMSRSAAAYEHCGPASFGLAVLFLWMKTWQSLFARRVKAQISGRSVPDLSIRRFLRIAVVQTILQPWGLILLTVSLVIVLPFGWVYAFFQNVTILGGEDGANPRPVFRRAWRQAQLWPGQNHLLLAILFLFGMAVVLNVGSGLVAVPSLLKMLFDIETPFTRSPRSFLNTTVLTTVVAVAWLCLDPLVKAAYALRCFYGESLQTGEDLKAGLKQFVSGTGAVATAGLMLLVIGGVQTAHGAAPPDRSAVPVATTELKTRGESPSPEALGRAIDHVLQRREFQWRLPREKPADDEPRKGTLAGFIDGVAATLRTWVKAAGNAIKAVVRWLGDVVEWLGEKVFGARRTTSDRAASGTNWMVTLQVLIFVLLALVSVGVVLLLFRSWRRRGLRETIASEAIAPVPDLSDENVTASQLPEDEWLRLARELMGRGEMRLAVRALYLASIAHLAQRQMISVAKFKSNRDYESELRRRARTLPDLQSAFAENGGIFDRVWYGLHDVTQEMVARFEINLERIKAC